MGKKRQDAGPENEHVLEKKHRKHKKHKHNKKKTDNDSFLLLSSPDGATVTSPQQSIKLKIKIGGQIVGTKSYSVTQDEGDDELSSVDLAGVNVLNASDDLSMDETGSSAVGSQVVEQDSSDDEQMWLDALESGGLDENGELRRQRDDTLLTARQRALLHGEREETLQQLPTAQKTATLTDEQINRREIRAKRRKEQAHEKSEKDKKETLDRLLKKQEAKAKGSSTVSKVRDKKSVPTYKYINNQSGIAVCVPIGFNFPLTHQMAPEVPALRHCAVTGCCNARKFSCSKTGVSLCSLQCYKTNLQLVDTSQSHQTLVT